MLFNEWSTVSVLLTSLTDGLAVTSKLKSTVVTGEMKNGRTEFIYPPSLDYYSDYLQISINGVKYMNTSCYISTSSAPSIYDVTSYIYSVGVQPIYFLGYLLNVNTSSLSCRVQSIPTQVYNSNSTHSFLIANLSSGETIISCTLYSKVYTFCIAAISPAYSIIEANANSITLKYQALMENNIKNQHPAITSVLYTFIGTSITREITPTIRKEWYQCLHKYCFATFIQINNPSYLQEKTFIVLKTGDITTSVEIQYTPLSIQCTLLNHVAYQNQMYPYNATCSLFTSYSCIFDNNYDTYTTAVSMGLGNITCKYSPTMLGEYTLKIVNSNYSSYLGTIYIYKEMPTVISFRLTNFNITTLMAEWHLTHCMPNRVYKASDPSQCSCYLGVLQCEVTYNAPSLFYALVVYDNDAVYASSRIIMYPYIQNIIYSIIENTVYANGANSKYIAICRVLNNNFPVIALNETMAYCSIEANNPYNSVSGKTVVFIEMISSANGYNYTVAKLNFTKKYGTQIKEVVVHNDTAYITVDKIVEAEIYSANIHTEENLHRTVNCDILGTYLLKCHIPFIKGISYINITISFPSHISNEYKWKSESSPRNGYLLGGSYYYIEKPMPPNSFALFRYGVKNIYSKVFENNAFQILNEEGIADVLLLPYNQSEIHIGTFYIISLTIPTRALTQYILQDDTTVLTVPFENGNRNVLHQIKNCDLIHKNNYIQGALLFYNKTITCSVLSASIQFIYNYSLRIGLNQEMMWDTLINVEFVKISKYIAPDNIYSHYYDEYILLDSPVSYPKTLYYHIISNNISYKCNHLGNMIKCLSPVQSSIIYITLADYSDKIISKMLFIKGEKPLLSYSSEEVLLPYDKEIEFTLLNPSAKALSLNCSINNMVFESSLVNNRGYCKLINAHDGANVIKIVIGNHILLEHTFHYISNIKFEITPQYLLQPTQKCQLLITPHSQIFNDTFTIKNASISIPVIRKFSAWFFTYNSSHPAYSLFYKSMPIYNITLQNPPLYKINTQQITKIKDHTYRISIAQQIPKAVCNLNGSFFYLESTTFGMMSDVKTTREGVYSLGINCLYSDINENLLPIQRALPCSNTLTLIEKINITYKLDKSNYPINKALSIRLITNYAASISVCYLSKSNTSTKSISVELLSDKLFVCNFSAIQSEGRYKLTFVSNDVFTNLIDSQYIYMANQSKALEWAPQYSNSSSPPKYYNITLPDSDAHTFYVEFKYGNYSYRNHCLQSLHHAICVTPISLLLLIQNQTLNSIVQINYKIDNENWSALGNSVIFSTNIKLLLHDYWIGRDKYCYFAFDPTYYKNLTCLFNRTIISKAINNATTGWCSLPGYSRPDASIYWNITFVDQNIVITNDSLQIKKADQIPLPYIVNGIESLIKWSKLYYGFKFTLVNLTGSYSLSTNSILPGNYLLVCSYNQSAVATQNIIINDAIYHSPLISYISNSSNLIEFPNSKYLVKGAWECLIMGTNNVCYPVYNNSALIGCILHGIYTVNSKSASIICTNIMGSIIGTLYSNIILILNRVSYINSYITPLSLKSYRLVVTCHNSVPTKFIGEILITNATKIALSFNHELDRLVSEFSYPGIIAPITTSILIKAIGELNYTTLYAEAYQMPYISQPIPSRIYTQDISQVIVHANWLPKDIEASITHGNIISIEPSINSIKISVFVPDYMEPTVYLVLASSKYNFSISAPYIALYPFINIKANYTPNIYIDKENYSLSYHYPFLYQPYMHINNQIFTPSNWNSSTATYKSERLRFIHDGYYDVCLSYSQYCPLNSSIPTKLVRVPMISGVSPTSLYGVDTTDLQVNLTFKTVALNIGYCTAKVNSLVSFAYAYQHTTTLYTCQFHNLSKAKFIDVGFMYYDYEKYAGTITVMQDPIVSSVYPQVGTITGGTNITFKSTLNTTSLLCYFNDQSVLAVLLSAFTYSCLSPAASNSAAANLSIGFANHTIISTPFIYTYVHPIQVSQYYPTTLVINSNSPAYHFISISAQQSNSTTLQCYLQYLLASQIPCEVITVNTTFLQLKTSTTYLNKNGIYKAYLTHNYQEIYVASEVNIVITPKIINIKCSQQNKYILLSIYQPVPNYAFKYASIGIQYQTITNLNYASLSYYPNGSAYSLSPFPSDLAPINVSIWVGDQLQSTCIVDAYQEIVATSLDYSQCTIYFNCNMTVTMNALSAAANIDILLDNWIHLPYYTADSLHISINSPPLSIGNHALNIYLNNSLIKEFSIAMEDTYQFKDASIHNSVIEIKGNNLSKDMFCKINDACISNSQIVNGSLLCSADLCIRNLSLYGNKLVSFTIQRDGVNGSSHIFSLYKTDLIQAELEITPNIIIEGSTSIFVKTSMDELLNITSFTLTCEESKHMSTCASNNKNSTTCIIPIGMFNWKPILVCDASFPEYQKSLQIAFIQYFYIESIKPLYAYSQEPTEISIQLNYVYINCSYICIVNTMFIKAKLANTILLCEPAIIPVSSQIKVGCIIDSSTMYTSQNYKEITIVLHPTISTFTSSILSKTKQRISITGSNFEASNLIYYGLSQYGKISLVNQNSVYYDIVYPIDKEYISISVENNLIAFPSKSKAVNVQLINQPTYTKILPNSQFGEANNLFIVGYGLSTLSRISIIVGDANVECNYAQSSLIHCKLPNINAGVYALTTQIENSISIVTAFSYTIYPKPDISITPTQVLRESNQIMQINISTTNQFDKCVLRSSTSNSTAVLSMHNLAFILPKLQSSGIYYLNLMNGFEQVATTANFEVLEQIEIAYVIPMLIPMDVPTLLNVSGGVFFSNTYVCNFEGATTSAIIINLRLLNCMSPIVSTEGIKKLSINWASKYETPLSIPLYFYRRLQPIDYHPKVLPISNTVNISVDITEHIYRRVYLECKINNAIIDAYLLNNKTLVCPSISISTAGNYSLYVSRNNISWELVGTVIFYSVPLIQKQTPATITELSQELIYIEGKGFLTINNAYCRFIIENGMVYDIISESTTSNLIQCHLPPIEASHSVQIHISYDGIYYYSTGSNISITNIPLIYSLSPSFSYCSISPNNATLNYLYMSDSTKLYIGGNQAYYSIATTPPYTAVPLVECSQLITSEIVLNSTQNSNFDTLFEYQYCPAITITSFSPLLGTITGGTLVSIYGSNFKNTPSLSGKFGSYISECYFNNSNLISCISPAIASLASSYPISITLNGIDYVTLSTPTYQYYDRIVLSSIIPSFAFKNTENFTIYILATNIAQNGDIYCKVHNLIIKGDYYLLNGSTPSVKCIVSSYKEINMTKLKSIVDDRVEIRLSNNGIDFSDSYLLFAFISNFDNFVSVFPLVGPSAGGTEIKLIVKQYLEDPYGQNRAVCIFGNIEMPLTMVDDTTLRCESPSKHGIENDLITCFNKAPLCSVKFDIILINNYFNFTYMYNDPIILESVLPEIITTETDTLLLIGSGFYESGLQKAQINISSKIYITPLFISDSHFASFNLTNNIKSLFPCSFTLKISINGLDYSTETLLVQAFDIDANATINPTIGPVSVPTLLKVYFQYYMLSDLECSFCFQDQCYSSITTQAEDPYYLYCSTLPPEQFSPALKSGGGNIELAIKRKNIQFSSDLTFTYYNDIIYAINEGLYFPSNWYTTYKIKLTNSFAYKTAFLKIELTDYTILTVFQGTLNNSSDYVFSLSTIDIDSGSKVLLSMSFNNQSFQYLPYQTITFNCFDIKSIIPIKIPVNQQYSLNVYTSMDLYYFYGLKCSFNKSKQVDVSYCKGNLIICDAPIGTSASTVNVEIYVATLLISKSYFAISYVQENQQLVLTPSVLYSKYALYINATMTGLIKYMMVFSEITYYSSIYSLSTTIKLSELEKGVYKIWRSADGLLWFESSTLLQVNECATNSICRETVIPCNSTTTCIGSINAEISCGPGMYSINNVCTRCSIGSYCPYINQSNPINCPRGYSCNEYAISSNAEMQMCLPGYICQNENSKNITQCPEGYWCGEGLLSSTPYIGDFTTPQPCISGTYCPATQLSISQYGTKCEPGSYCIDGLKYQCQPGHYCGRNSLVDQLNCLPGFYSKSTNVIACTKCELGTYCPLSEMTNPILCTQGNNCFLYGQSMTAEMCEGGYYCSVGVITKREDSIFSPFNSNLCDKGTYCLPGTWNKSVMSGNRGFAEICREGTYCLAATGKPEGTDLCPPGHYCPAGTFEPIPAEPGYYCSGEGNTMQTPCPPGSYSDIPESTECSQCPKGYYCENEKTTTPILCPAGTYRERSSNTIYCNLCPEGTWSNMTGLDSSDKCIVCKAGIVCDKEGMTSEDQARKCSEGYRCPQGTRSDNEYKYPCPAGYWCSNGTASIADYHLCEQGYYCQQATTEVNKNKNLCKKGYFCPRGTNASASTDDDGIEFSVVNTEEVMAAKWEKFNLTGIPDSDLIELSECQENARLPITLINSYVGLKCPEATTSDYGSYCLGQCFQISTANPVLIANPFNSPLTRKLSEDDYWYIPSLNYAIIRVNLSRLPSELAYPQIYTITLIDNNKNVFDLPPVYTEKLKEGNCDLLLKLFNPNKNQIGFKFTLNIMNGLFKDYGKYLIDIASISILKSDRASIGTNQLFGFYLSKAKFSQITLPYNIPDVKALPSLYIDIVDKSLDISSYMSNYTVDPVENTYWLKNSVKSVALTFLPFHSACKGYGSHIILSELIQDTSFCKLINVKETKVVDQTPFMTSTPTADICDTLIKCNYEEPLKINKLGEYRWYQIVDSRTIYYITSQPLVIEKFLKADSLNEYETAYANELENNLDMFIPVIIKGANESGVPRLVTYNIKYKQHNITTKSLVSMEIHLSNYSTDDSIEYSVQIHFTPMVYSQLLNSFQFGIAYYFILFAGISGTLILIAFICYILNSLIIRKKYFPVKLKQFFEATFEAPIIGAVLGQVPSLALFGFSIIMGYFPLKQTIAQWTLIGVDESADQKIYNQYGRTGASFLIASLILFSIGAKLMVPKPKTKEQSKLKEIERIKKENEKKIAKEENEENEDMIKEEDENNVSDMEFEEITKFNSVTTYKRRYFIFYMIFSAIWLIYLIKLSFTKVFANNVIYFQLGFVLLEVGLEQLMTRLMVKEALLVAPILTSLMMIEFIMTLGANSFLGFIISYYIEHILAIITRIYVEPLIEKLEFALFLLFVKLCSKYKLINRIFGNYVKNLLIIQKRQQTAEEFMGGARNDSGHGQEAMLGFLNTYSIHLSTFFMLPIMILIIKIYSDETKITMHYSIRQEDLTFYLIFSLVTIIPQYFANLIILRTLEIVHGYKTYDYLYYSKYKFEHRSYVWVGKNVYLDKSIAFHWRTLDNMCYSSQYFFANIICSWAILFFVLGITIIGNTDYQVFSDPSIWVYLCIFLGFAGISYYIFSTLGTALKIWSIKKRDHLMFEMNAFSVIDRNYGERLLINELGQEIFRDGFINKNKEWIVQNINKIWKYNIKSSDPVIKLYERAINDEANEEFIRFQQTKNSLINQPLEHSVSEINAIRNEDTAMPFLSKNCNLETKEIALTWLKKAKDIIRFKYLIRTPISLQMKTKCETCQGVQKLYLIQKRNFYKIFNAFAKEACCDNYTSRYWIEYFMRYQNFKTICGYCRSLIPLKKMGDMGQKDALGNLMTDIIRHTFDISKFQLKRNMKLAHKRIAINWLLLARSRLLNFIDNRKEENDEDSIVSESFETDAKKELDSKMHI